MPAFTEFKDKNIKALNRKMAFSFGLLILSLLLAMSIFCGMYFWNAIESSMKEPILSAVIYILMLTLILLSIGIFITLFIIRHFGKPIHQLAFDMSFEHQRLENILNAIGCATWDWDIKNHRVILDERWANMLGYQLADLGPINENTARNLTHPDDAEIMAQAFNDHLTGKAKNYTCEVRIRHKKGYWVWILDSGQITEWDDKGNPLRAMGARQDISSRKAAELAAHRETERFSALTKIATTGVWEWDENNKALWCNHEYFAMLGLDIPACEANIDQFWFDLLHPDDQEKSIDNFSNYLSNDENQNYESMFRMRHTNGDWIWILSRGSKLKDENGELTTKTLGVHIDITSLKQIEFALQESQKRIETISSNIPDCMVYQLDCGLNGEFRKFTYLTDRIESIHGISIADALEDANLLYKQVVPEDAVILAETEKYCIREMKQFKSEARFILPSGEQRWFLINSFPRYLSNGHLVFDGIELDITERKLHEQQINELNANLELRVHERTQELSTTLKNLQRAQEELLQNEKLASLGSLVAGVAHELNTPIGNAVMVASSLVLANKNIRTQIQAGLTRSQLESYLTESDEGSHIIERNLERAAELIRSFKQLAVDQTSYQRREFMLHDLVQEICITLHPTLRKTPHKLINNIQVGLLFDSFPGPLSQVLINLINNALIHAFDSIPEGEIYLEAQRTNENWLCISVRDNGIGISPANLKKIFDPFFTTKLGHGGSGLGLHIVYNLVTGLLGGRVEATSTEGHGCAFILHLPLIAPAEK